LLDAQLQWSTTHKRTGRFWSEASQFHPVYFSMTFGFLITQTERRDHLFGRSLTRRARYRAERITVLFMTPSRIALSYLWVFASAVAGYSTNAYTILPMSGFLRMQTGSEARLFGVNCPRPAHRPA